MAVDTRSSSEYGTFGRTFRQYSQVTDTTTQASTSKLRWLGEVTSTRGKRPKPDEYGFVKPNNFELKKQTLTVHNGFWRVINLSTNPLALSQEYTGPGWPLYWNWVDTADIRSWVLDHFEDTRLGLLAQSKAEAYERLKSPKIPGATWIAEFAETVEYLIDIVRGFVKLWIRYRSMEKLLVKNYTGATLADEIADLWLQWRYAVLPLILQVRDVVEFFNTKELTTGTFSGSAKRVIKLPLMSSVTNLQSRLGITVTTQKKCTIEATTKLYVAHRHDPTPYGMGLVDTILAGWEVIPLSFVVDWFLGIGTWLGGLRPNGAQIIHQSSTVVTRYVEDVQIASMKLLQPNLATGSVGWGGAQLAVHHVLRSTAVDQPSFPLINREALIPERWADAIALILKAARNR